MILRQWFERVDSQKTGSITATKLKHYCRMYDLDPNGTMSFEGFVELSKFLLKVSYLLRSDMPSQTWKDNPFPFY
ncbi:uncharacterized protein LOC110825307 isoform X7 [Carica papaya]|uniref:uncharacterized protein LOC110825307 isoform X7 n=1 Tax=Carica papaya TaxID=3649 RepID=UPI000B8C9D85|nr:uncharacterized protein LOC110825307 isoform X7 [Carica papaya]